MGEDSTSQTLDESPGHRSCLAAPHAAKKRGGCTHAAVALANVQAARQELTFQEPNAHSLPYPLMISGRDWAFELYHWAMVHLDQSLSVSALLTTIFVLWHMLRLSVREGTERRMLQLLHFA
jgi:hypothetical protein